LLLPSYTSLLSCPVTILLLQADTLREMLEQIMDDEDELRELNLSSRPRREERRKQRERERMERQLTR
jgi:hypothetical protein